MSKENLFFLKKNLPKTIDIYRCIYTFVPRTARINFFIQNKTFRTRTFTYEHHFSIVGCHGEKNGLGADESNFRQFSRHPYRVV